MREDFLSIKKMIEQSKRDKIHLLKQVIPGLATIGSWEILEQLGYVFNEQKFLKNDYLSFQGEKSNTMYILVSGQLEVSQSIEMELDAPEMKYMSKLNKFIEGSQDPSKKSAQQASNSTKKIEQSSSSLIVSNEQSKNQGSKEQIEVKICDIDIPQFVCEDILAFKTQQYNVKVVSSKVLCYLKFPRESIEMTKQLFLSKFERRQEAINEKLLKYKDRFKEEERKQSFNEMNQKFKQKFKKQYLNQIFAQSILNTNVDQEKQKKEFVFQYQKTEQQIQQEKVEQKEKLKQARQFLSQKNQVKSSSQFNNEETAQNTDYTDYIKGIDTMKKNFSDYILECVKKEVDSNLILTFKKSEIFNKQRAASDLSQSQRLLMAEQDKSSRKKSGSIFINEGQQQKSSRSSFSLSQSKQIQEEDEILTHNIDFVQQHYYKEGLSSKKIKKISMDGTEKRRSTLMKVLDGDPKRKTSILNQISLNQNSKSESYLKKNLQFEKNNELSKVYQTEEDNFENKEEYSNENLITESESESSQNSISHASSNQSIQANMQQKPDLNYQYKQRASLFKNEKAIDLQNIYPLPQINPISDRQNSQKQNSSANSSPKAFQQQDKPEMIQSSPKIKFLQQLQGSVNQEKSLLLEDTWDMGFGNEKQLEIDLKQQLKIRGLLKIEQQKTEIKQLFPALSKYQRGKIEQKIQKIKEQSQKINNHAAANMQVTAVQDNSNQASHRSLQTNDKSCQEYTADKSLQPMDFIENQKQIPNLSIDQNDTLTLNKQLSLPAISNKNIQIQNKDNPSLYFPKISQTPQSKNNAIKLDSLSTRDLQSQRDSLSLQDPLSFRGSISQRAPLEQITPKIKSKIKHLNLAQLNNQTQNRVQSQSIGGVVQDEILQGFKCGSPLSSKLNSLNTPRSQLFKSGQAVLGQNSLSSARIKSISSPMSILMKDATIQTPKQAPIDFDSQDYLLSSQKKKDPEIIRQKNVSELGQNMLQRINYQRPTIFHNVLNREKKPFNVSTN